MKGTLVAIPVIIGVAAAVFLAGMGGNDTNEHMLTPENLRAGGSPDGGNPDAPITIIEYGDYQCTFCYRFHQDTLKTLKAEYVDTGMVNIIFKDFVLNGEDSILAAHASHCANDQMKYWEYHDTIYDNWAGEKTGWVTRQALAGFAAELGMDAAAFEQCMDRDMYRQMIIDAYKTAQDAGIDATPTFLIFNDQKVIKITGNQPLSVFVRAIEEL